MVKIFVKSVENVKRVKMIINNNQYKIMKKEYIEKTLVEVMWTINYHEEKLQTARLQKEVLEDALLKLNEQENG